MTEAHARAVAALLGVLNDEAGSLSVDEAEGRVEINTTEGKRLGFLEYNASTGWVLDQ